MRLKKSNLQHSNIKKTMKKLEKHSTCYFIYLLSFLIPCIITAVAFYLNNIYPTSSNTILTHDLRCSLLPTYGYLSHLGIGFNNLFYNSMTGLGGNFWSIFASDISTLDFIYHFVALEYLADAIYFIIIFRIGLSGLFCSVFLLKNKKIIVSHSWTIILSCCYSLMSYSIIYSSWSIFQVAIVILPLITLGLENIISNKKSLLFIISLSYSIISCYYTSYMIIIFLVLYFIFRLLEEKYDLKTILIRIKLFIIHGILSAGISFFIILPIFLDLTRSKYSSENAILQSDTIQFNLIQVLKQLLPTSYSNLNANQLPNIFCSTIVVLLCLVYLFRKCTIKEKALDVSIFIIYLLSFIVSPIDRIWHGFSEPVGYSCRYAFTFVFFMICFAIRGLALLSHYNIRISSILKNIIRYSVLFYTLIELLINASYLTSKIAEEYEFENKEKYLRLCETTENILQKINSYEEDYFYRITKNYGLSMADDELFGYNGIECFSSSYNGSVIEFCRKVGMNSVYNTIVPSGLTPPIANILNTKYIISHYTDLTDYYTHIDDYKSYQIYLNENAFPLAFIMDNASDKSLSDLGADPYMNINSIYSDIHPTDNLIYEPISCEILSYSYSPEKDTNLLTLKFHAPCDGHYWLFIASVYDSDFNNNILPKESVSLMYDLDDQEVGTIGEHNRRYCSDIGYIESNTDHLLTIDVGSSIGANIYLYHLNNDALNEVCSSVNRFDVTENSPYGIGLNGYLDSPSDLFISLPYEKGYIISVNGVKTPYDAYRNTFLLLHLDKGNNNIHITYRPYGLITGIIISAITIIVSLIYFLSFKKMNIGTENQSTDQTQQ